MSKLIFISCSRCGRDIYKPLAVPEIRNKEIKHFNDFYLVSENGQQEELCSKCFAAWQKEEKGDPDNEP